LLIANQNLLIAMQIIPSLTAWIGKARRRTEGQLTVCYGFAQIILTRATMASATGTGGRSQLRQSRLL
jgi:hypothetical protein